MSAYFSTASTANYLRYDAGSEADFSYPFTVAVWQKHPSVTTTGTALSFADDNAGSASLRYTSLGMSYNTSSMRYSYNHRSETFQAYETGSTVNPPANTWYALILVATSATSRTFYWGTSSSSYSTNTGTGDAGSLLSIRYATVGALWRASGSITNPFNGYVARAARWTTGLTQAEVESYLNGTEPTSIQSGSLWGYWKLNGSSLTDSSGNNRTLTMTGTVGNSTDEPFATALTKKLKLLANSSAASASGIAGVVFSAPSGSDITGTTRYGEFTGKSFESTLESGKAVLKVPVADFGGTALTTASTPVALVRNTTNTTGIIACTVIEE